MATTWYHTVRGEIIGESTAGSRTSYLSDALSSTTAAQNSAGTTTATWRYKPSGALLAKTGVGTDPKFLWVGGLGSRTTGLAIPQQYTRARHYCVRAGLWTSMDAFWPSELPYAYANQSPVSLMDFSGYGLFVNECRCSKCINGQPGPPGPQNPPVIRDGAREACAMIAKCKRNPTCFKGWADCIDRMPGYSGSVGAQMITCMYNLCMGNTFNVWIDCNRGFSCSSVIGGACAVTGPGSPCKIQICATPEDEYCGVRCVEPPDPMGEPWYFPIYARCDKPNCGDTHLGFTIVHELSHCCGMSPGGWFRSPDLGNELYECLVANV